MLIKTNHKGLVVIGYKSVNKSEPDLAFNIGGTKQSNTKNLFIAGEKRPLVKFMAEKI